MIRSVKALTFMIILILILCSCSKEPEPETVEIDFLHGWGGPTSDHIAMRKIFEDFGRANDDILLIFSALPQSSIAMERANDMLAAGDVPDIVSTNGNADFVQNAIKMKRAVNLMPYLEKDPEFMACISQAVLDTWTDESGAIYTLPDALELSGYWYNEDIFRRAGITQDGTPNTPVTLPVTWNDFWTACDKITNYSNNNNLDLKPFALETVQVVENFFLARLAGMGNGGLEFIESQPLDFQSSFMQKGVQEIKRAYHYSNTVTGIENARYLFMEGKSAIYFNGIWEMEPLSNSPLSNFLKCSSYPTESGKSLSYASPSSGYVVLDSHNPKKIDACIKFLKYILSKPVQIKIALETEQAPSNLTIDMEIVKESNLPLGKAIEIMMGTDIQIKTINSIWEKRNYDSLVNYFTSVKEEDISYEEIIKNLNQ